MKHNYKQLLVEEVDGSNCEALYQQTIKITLSTEDTLVSILNSIIIYRQNSSCYYYGIY